MLLDFGFIKEISVGNRSILTDTKILKNEAIIYYYINKKDEIHLIFQELIKKPCTINDLSNATMLPKKNLRYYMEVFKEREIIQELIQVEHKVYIISDDFLIPVTTMLQC